MWCEIFGFILPYLMLKSSWTRSTSNDLQMQDVKKGLERAKRAHLIEISLLRFASKDSRAQNISTLGLLKWVGTARLFSRFCSFPFSIELKLILTPITKPTSKKKRASNNYNSNSISGISSKPSYHCFPKKSRDFWSHLLADGIWRWIPHKWIRLLPQLNLFHPENPTSLNQQFSTKHWEFRILRNIVLQIFVHMTHHF